MFLACLGVMYLVLPPHTDSDTRLCPALDPIMSASTSPALENIPINTGESVTSFTNLAILSEPFPSDSWLIIKQMIYLRKQGP